MDRYHRRILPGILVILLLSAQAALAAGAASDTAATLAEQINVALTHARFALASDTAQGFRTHAHHVVNILVGQNGMGLDASFGNPGDGYGALEYARDLRSDPSIEAAGWGTVAQNIAGWLEKGAQEGLQAVRAADGGQVDAAASSLVTAVAFVSAALGREGEEPPVAGALALRSGLPAETEAEPEAAAGGGYY